MLEYQGEWVDGDIFYIVVQQIWIGIWNDQVDNQDCEDVKQQDMLEDLVYCVWNVFFWIFRFIGSDVDKFGVLE